MIQANFEETSLCKRQGGIVGETEIQCNLPLSESEVAKLLGISPKVTLSGAEIIDGQVSYGGKAIFCVMFVDSDGKVKKAECGAEFEQRLSVNAEIENGVPTVKLSLEKVRAESVNGILSVKAKVIANIEIICEKKLRYAVGGEDLFLKKQEKTVSKKTCSKKAIYPIEEEFEIGYAIEEVLLHKTEASLTAITTGVGVVTVDGEAYLSVCLLQKIEKSDILKETKSFPFRFEIEAEESMPSSTCTALAVVKSAKLDIVVDEETGKSVVKLSAQIELSVDCYEDRNGEVLVDAYSSTHEVILQKESETFCRPSDYRNEKTEIKLRAGFNESLAGGSRLMCVAVEKLEATQIKAQDGVLRIEGVLETIAFIKDGEGTVFSKKLEAPFETVFAVETGCEYTATLRAENVKGKLLSLSEVELTATVVLSLQNYKKETVDFICALEVGKEKKVKTQAMSVYIPLAGEELWDVAKRLNSSPEVILEINRDLTFPLTGEERLLIYRQEKKNY